MVDCDQPRIRAGISRLPFVYARAIGTRVAVPTERQSISFKDPMPRDVGQGFHESILAERYRVLVAALPGCGSCIPRAGYYKKTIAATIGELVRRPDLRRLKMVDYNHGTRVAYTTPMENVTHAGTPRHRCNEPYRMKTSLLQKGQA